MISDAHPPRRVGVMMLDTAFHRFPGDAGHLDTWPGGGLIERVAGADVHRVVREGDAGLVALFQAAGERLIARGATILTTTCGFLVVHQRALEQALPVPVVTSALLGYRHMSAHRVGILTYEARSLTARHLSAAEIPENTPVFGFPPDSAFHRWIEGGADPVFSVLEAEMIALGCMLIRAHPDTGAILMECANMPPFADAVSAATGVPVRHILHAVKETPDRFRGPALEQPGARLVQ
ncbi:MAG: aspartate/glutamate racemase family protein [Beijerinckiaceae bacterium]